MSRDSTDPRSMNPLQRLILDQMRVRGWDAKTVEDRGVAHATLHRYMNPVKLSQLPRRSVMEALASALDLTYEQVKQAAMGAVDWHPMATDADRLTEPDLIARMDAIQEDNRQLREEMVEFKRLLAERNHPTTQAPPRRRSP